MRKTFAIAAALSILAVLSSAAIPATKQKSASKSGTKQAASKNRKAGTRAASPKGARKAGPRPLAARSRQAAPTPDRYRQIQQALATKGYLASDQATGQWTETSTDALKRFQADQKLDATGKINSLSLIALGLGPKHDAAPAAAPAAP